MKSLASQASHQAQLCQLSSGRWPPLQVRHTAGCKDKIPAQNPEVQCECSQYLPQHVGVLRLLWGRRLQEAE